MCKFLCECAWLCARRATDRDLERVSAVKQLSSFVVFHLFSWHVRAMEQMCQYFRYQPPLRILVPLLVPFLTLKGQDTGYRPQYDEGENQRNVHTNRKVATAHAECIQI